MDLIRREKAINSVYDGTSYDILTEECKRHIEEVPSAFEGMTYGEVVKAVFPNAVIKRDDSNLIIEVLFTDEVWNAPYKGVSE